MKKMNMVTSLAMAGMIGMGTYILMNKNTKAKADKLINNMLERANECTTNMCK